MFISLKDVTLQAGSRPCFEHTTWAIERGQHWAILGQTGSGKSLLARALCRQVPLLHGQILYYFDGADPAHPDEGQGRPYFDPQKVLILSSETHQAFLARYAGYHQARWQSFEGENAPTVSALLSAEGLRPRFAPAPTSPEIEGKAFRGRREELIRLFHLKYLLERKILHISHGESRKVFIARLLLQAPRLLVLDDPYSGLDQESRRVLAGGIDTLLTQGEPQILFISPRLEDIPSGIDHLLVVKDTRVVSQGSRQEILEDQECRLLISQQPSPAPGFQASPVFSDMVAAYTSSVAGSDSPAAVNGPLAEGSSSPALVKMEAVSIRYEGVDVLSNINWTVRKGERWAVLGHNGAGKTTLLSLILADNPQAYANPVTLFGKRRGSGESIWDIKKNIGWVSPEQHIYYPHTATCLDVVCSGFYDSAGLYQRPTAAQSHSAVGWIEAFGIDRPVDTPFQALSTGQQRLALLARSLVKHPPLLVLDEPCQGLDARHRRHIIELLDQLCAVTPLTLIYVSHYQDELPASITHQLRLDHGRVV